MSILSSHHERGPARKRSDITLCTVLFGQEMAKNKRCRVSDHGYDAHAEVVNSVNGLSAPKNTRLINQDLCSSTESALRRDLITSANQQIIRQKKLYHSERSYYCAHSAIIATEIRKWKYGYYPCVAAICRAVIPVATYSRIKKSIEISGSVWLSAT
jgi:hypothetical protein